MGVRASNPWVPMAEAAAAAALGGACAFAAARLLLAHGMVGGVPAASALTCGLVFLLAYAALSRGASAGSHHVPAFALEPLPKLDREPLGELLLTDADRRVCDLREDSGGADGGELLLDDILAELQPDDRVVRLFDVNPLPTPGQLQARIDRHLSSSGSRSAPPDASEALHQALAELRRSLR